jgi:Protein of unknown function (DUF1232)
MAFARAFKPGTPGISRRLSAVPRMIKASMKGEYDGGFRLFLMGLASIYIVSPLDAVPELFLGLFGLIDDAVVVSWLVGTLLGETERFLEWEKQQRLARQHIIPGQIVGGGTPQPRP